MKFEFSAGGVVYKNQKSKIKDQKGDVFILLCQHSYHHGWVFPKGLIGDSIKDEKKEATAVREVEEETGAKAEIRQALEAVTYWYNFEGQKIKKTVYYFVMKYISGDITKHDFEMENVEWVKSEEVLDKLTYKADKEVFTQALPIIEKLVNSSSC